MRILCIGFMLYLSAIFGDYSIIFVHIGDEIPPYAHIAISQARLFNPNARIIFLSNHNRLQHSHSFQLEENIELCSYENLPKSQLHREYQERCVETAPFWRYTSERFLYLWDLMEHYGLENIFHLENDNMLYANLEPLVPYFQSQYPGIGATFDNEERCIPGFVWIANCNAMKALASHFVKEAPKRLSDMYVIGSYRKQKSTQWIDSLPIIMSDYATIHPLQSPHRHKTDSPQAYSNHSETFNAIFDAAAIGQFLGGIDPIHANNQPGFINESCLFNPSFLDYQWILDEQGRSVPYALFLNRSYKIMNLHIHSKKLHEFKSS